MINRRTLLAGLAALPATRLSAEQPREIMWEELIPPGVPYSEIIGEGEMDEAADTWLPIFDANGTKFNEALNGQMIRMPGYVLPLDNLMDATQDFILVPYQGACIHVPPPPPNQLVLVHAETPWRLESIFDAVWVEGRLTTSLQSTELAEIGYFLEANKMELYQWL